MKSDNKNMSSRLYLLVFLGIILFLGAAGCIEHSIGDVTYNAGNVSVLVINNGEPVNAGMELKVYSIGEYSQKEYTMTGITTQFATGSNRIDIPVVLKPGHYKLYLYITKNGQRETAVIRDIIV